MAHRAIGDRARACVHRRGALQRAELLAQLRAHARAPRARLRPPDGASADTAKEVKIFGLNGFLIERYRTLAEGFFAANRGIALRRAGWGSLLSAVGTVAYYVAYAYIVWRTLHGDFTIGDLTFLAGSFRRLRNLLENLLMGFSQVAGQALYLEDLFSFFEIRPEIVPRRTRGRFRCRSGRGSRSTTSASGTPVRSAGRCAG